MKTLLATILLGCPFAYLNLQADPDRRPDWDKPIPLVWALKDFNTKYPDGNPLTEEEVIAAVRAIKTAHPNMDEDLFRLYQKVAEDRVLPPGFYFSRSTYWKIDGWEYEVDWKDLIMEILPEHGLKKNFAGFGYRIRARFISSKPVPGGNKVKVAPTL